MLHFNLIDESWIPLLRPDGTTQNVSLRHALNHASEYTGIESGSGVTDLALLRLMLVVVHRATLGPARSEDAAMWVRDGFPAGQIDAYLDRPEVYSRFDLFGDTPFMQVPGLPTEFVTPSTAKPGKNPPKEKVTSWTDPVLRLQQEHWKENNPSTNWRMRSVIAGDRISALHPAAAARALVTYLPNALAGLMRRVVYSSAASPVGDSILTTVIGEDLHATLCLNATPYEADLAAVDAPLWEQPPVTLEQIIALNPGKADEEDSDNGRLPALGRTHRMTWPTRSVRLLPVIESGEVRVREMALAGGIGVSAPIYGAGRDIDPMVTVRRVKLSASEQKRTGQTEKDDTWKLAPQHLGRMLWRDLLNILPGEGRQPPGVLTHARDVIRTLTDRSTEGLTARERRAARRASGGGATPVLRTVLQGTASSQAKIEGMRTFRVDLPQAYLSSPARFADVLAGPLDLAGEARAALYAATRRFAEEILAQRHRDEHADIAVNPKTAQAYALNLLREEQFWANLNLPFAELLAHLDQDKAGALLRWKVAVGRAARSAWEQTVQAGGDSAESVRAEVLASPKLLHALRALTISQEPA